MRKGDENMDFSKALTALKNTQKVHRKVWKHTYLEVKEQKDLQHPVIYLCEEDSLTGKVFKMVYTPLQYDLFAEDWEVIQEDTIEKYKKLSEQLQKRLDEEGLYLKELLNVLFLGE